MKYKDPFIGEIELTEIGETSMSGMGEIVIRTVYTDERGNYHIDAWSTTGGDRTPMTFIHKSVIEIILENERNKLPNGK